LQNIYTSEQKRAHSDHKSDRFNISISTFKDSPDQWSATAS